MEHLLLQSDDLQIEKPPGPSSLKETSTAHSEPKPKKGKLGSEVEVKSEVFETAKKENVKRKMFKSVIGKVVINGTEVLPSKVGLVTH